MFETKTIPVFVKELSKTMPGEWKIYVRRPINEIWFRYSGADYCGTVMFNLEELSLAFNEREVAMIVSRKIKSSPQSDEDFILNTLLRNN